MLIIYEIIDELRLSESSRELKKKLQDFSTVIYRWTKSHGQFQIVGKKLQDFATILHR